MARVTVEDCIRKVPNRFDLIILAAYRSREIVNGAPLTVERDNDKNPVIALREIAEGTVDKEEVYASLVTSMQRVSHHEEQVRPQEEQKIVNVDEDIMPTEDIAEIGFENTEQHHFDDIDKQDLDPAD